MSQRRSRGLRAIVMTVSLVAFAGPMATAEAAGPSTAGPAVEARIRSASAHYRAGRLADAIRDLTTAAALEPRNARVRFMLGNAMFRDQRHREAADAYRAALALDPDQADAHLNLGFVLHRRGETEGALAAWRQAVEQSRRDPMARVALALGEQTAGNADAALFHLSIAVYLDTETERPAYYEQDFRWKKEDVLAIEGMLHKLTLPSSN